MCSWVWGRGIIIKKRFGGVLRPAWDAVLKFRVCYFSPGSVGWGGVLFMHWENTDGY